MPTQNESDTLHVYWLTNNAPWDPNSVSDTLPVPLGYSNTLGDVNLLDLDISRSDLGEVNKDSMEIDKAMHWIRVQQSNIQYKHTKIIDADFEKYQPFLGWKALDVLRKTFVATMNKTCHCGSELDGIHVKSMPYCRPYRLVCMPYST